MSLGVEDKEFKNFPVVLCKYKTKTDEEKVKSGTRGDGLCSIWAVLNGWDLLGRKEFIKNNWSQNWTSGDAKKVEKFQISDIIDLIRENLIKFIELMGDRDDIEIEGYTLFKGECQSLLEQLLKWKKLSTINGHTHFQILSILLGCQIKVRILEDGVGRLEIYGADSLGGIIRITTTGSHYDFHCRNKNGSLKGFNKYWWGKQWGKTSTSGVYPDMILNTATPITKDSNEYYGITIKSSKKKSKSQTRKKQKSYSKSSERKRRSKSRKAEISRARRAASWRKKLGRQASLERKNEDARAKRAAKWRKAREDSAERKNEDAQAKRAEESAERKRRSKSRRAEISRARRAASWREKLERKGSLEKKIKASTKIQSIFRGIKQRLNKTKKTSNQMKKIRKKTRNLPKLSFSQMQLIKAISQQNNKNRRNINNIPAAIAAKAPKSHKALLKKTKKASNQMKKTRKKTLNLPKLRVSNKERMNAMKQIPKNFMKRYQIPQPPQPPKPPTRGTFYSRKSRIKSRIKPKPPSQYKKFPPPRINTIASPGVRVGYMDNDGIYSNSPLSDSSMSASSMSASSMSASQPGSIDLSLSLSSLGKGKKKRITRKKKKRKK